jgi:hypothetical protein
MSKTATVLEALRHFLPELLKTAPALSDQQRRAIWAITHCRTAALGGRVFDCPCGQVHFAYHSCNHKACPQCGAQATRRWIDRELGKRVNAPYFLVTFTLPAELRGCFFGPLAKQACDLFFAAVSGSLAERLAADKGLRASINDCHPRAKAGRLRAQLHSGSAVEFGAGPVRQPASSCQKCSRCGQPMRLRACLPSAHKIRGPPAAKASQPATSIAA